MFICVEYQCRPRPPTLPPPPTPPPAVKYVSEKLEGFVDFLSHSVCWEIISFPVMPLIYTKILSSS